MADNEVTPETVPMYSRTTSGNPIFFHGTQAQITIWHGMRRVVAPIKAVWRNETGTGQCAQSAIHP